MATRPKERFVEHLLRPYTLMCIPLLLSAGAWLFPNVPGLRRGFYKPEIVSAEAILILLLWYGAMFSASFLGFHLGELITLPLSDRHTIRAPLDSSIPYLVFTALASLGVAYTYGTIAARGALAAYFANAGASSANMLKDALYENYSIGPLSLRYVGIISGTIAFYRLMRNGRCGWLEYLNFFLVLAISFLSGRMLLLWTMCGVLGAYSLLQDPFARRRASRVLGLLVIFSLAMLWILNYSRNHLFYQASGQTSFLLSGLGEVLSYLGAPIQVSLGIANHWSLSVAGADPWSIVEYDARNLTTNSALSQLLPLHGWFSIAILGFQCLLFSAIAGWCSRQKNSYFYFGLPILGYGFAEIWRLDLFSFGIYYCLASLVLFVPLVFGGRKASGYFVTLSPFRLPTRTV